MDTITQNRFNAENDSDEVVVSLPKVASSTKKSKPQDFSILIVDDEPDLREILSFDFERIGYRVDTAAGGIEALAKFKEKAFDLVITDIRMPLGDGLTLLRDIKVLSQVTPVICITGFSEVSSTTMLEQGALGVFEKPFDRKKLHKTVFDVLAIQTES